jgi:hypothetical protein
MEQKPMRPIIERLEVLSRQVDIAEAIDVAQAAQDVIITFMNDCPAACFVKDASTGKYLYVNKACEGMLGTEAIGKTDADIFPLEAAQKLVAHDLVVLTKGTSFLIVEPLQSHGKRAVLFLKFIVQNGTKSIGGLAIELPDSMHVLAEGSQ